MFGFVRDAGARGSELVALLRRARNGATPPPAPVRPAPAPSPPAARTLIPGVDRVALVAVFGLPAGTVARIVDQLLAEQETGGVVPVFLTDAPVFSVFRERRARFEYLPRPATGAAMAPDLDWRLYQARRLSLLCRKWPVVSVLSMGPVAGAVLAAWREEQAEDPVVVQVLARGDESAISIKTAGS